MSLLLCDCLVAFVGVWYLFVLAGCLFCVCCLIVVLFGFASYCIVFWFITFDGFVCCLSVGAGYDVLLLDLFVMLWCCVFGLICAACFDFGCTGYLFDY